MGVALDQTRATLGVTHVDAVNDGSVVHGNPSQRGLCGAGML